MWALVGLELRLWLWWREMGALRVTRELGELYFTLCAFKACVVLDCEL